MSLQIVKVADENLYERWAVVNTLIFAEDGNTVQSKIVWAPESEYDINGEEGRVMCLAYIKGVEDTLRLENLI